MARGEATSWSKIVRWPAFLVLNASLMFLVGVSTIRETYRGWNVEKEIQTLEAHAAGLEGRKLQLQTLTEALVSPEQVELDARSRLGRKRPNERVIILGGGSSTEAVWQGDPGTSAEVVLTPVEQRVSNPERWKRYFFR